MRWQGQGRARRKGGGGRGERTYLKVGYGDHLEAVLPRNVDSAPHTPIRPSTHSPKPRIGCTCCTHKDFTERIASITHTCNRAHAVLCSLDTGTGRKGERKHSTAQRGVRTESGNAQGNPCALAPSLASLCRDSPTHHTATVSPSHSEHHTKPAHTLCMCNRCTHNRRRRARSALFLRYFRPREQRAEAAFSPVRRSS